MDDFERLFRIYAMRDSTSPASRIDVLMDLERIGDVHILPFLLEVLGDLDEPDVDGVLVRLSTISLARNESIDLRYAAFTSLERGGPIPECIALLRHISSDEMLGRCARGVLSAWHIDS
jgi:hypothetical protein